MSWIYTLIVSSLMLGVGSDVPSTGSGTETAVLDTPAVVSTVLPGESKVIDRSFPLSANGKLSVSNLNGSIDIKAWDANEVKVVATITADSKERLEQVDVKFNERPDSLEIETDYGDWTRRNSGDSWRTGGNASVSYSISAPRGAVLSDIETVNGSVTLVDFTNVIKSSAVNGSIRATNIRGTVSLETVNGEVFADFERLDANSKIALSTVNGRVNLVLPSDINATIKADSLNGNITNDFGLPVRKGKYIGRDLYGKIGRGDVYIKLESVNGTLNVGRKNDAKQLNPATDLLPQKGKDEDDGDLDIAIADLEAARSAAKMNKELSKLDRATARASAEIAAKIEATAPELARMGAEAAKFESERAKMAVAAVDLKGMGKFKVDLEKMAATVPGYVIANYSPAMPRVVRQSNTLAVKGAPDVIIEANGVDVRVIGWDEPSLKYSLLEIANSRSRDGIKINEEKSDSKITLTVEGTTGVRPAGMRFDHRIVVYVPRRSDLKVKTEGEIRVEGVSGKLNVEGGEQSVNLRDVKGELNVSSTEGMIRVVGFDGKLDAASECGLISLEGTFSSLNALSDEGEIIVTLPAASNAQINAVAKKVRSEGVDLVRGDADDSFRLGRGGNVFKIETSNEVIIRSSESILSVE